MSELTPKDFLFMGETKIMGFGESDTSGMWVKLQVHDLEVFRGMKGEILETALRVVNNDGTTPDMQGKAKLKGGKICRDAVILCKELSFQNYCRSITGIDCTGSEAVTKSWLLSVCEIDSRAELDHNGDALAKFRELHRKFTHWVDSHGY